MNVKNIIRWISTTVGITSSFLISTSVSNSHIYEIQYKNTVNIDVNNLTRKYNSNVETKLIKAKAKNGFIFLGWKLKDETIIDTIAVGTQENIILSPVLINEYPNYSSIKNLFINSSSKINFDIRVIKIKQLITKEELAFGNEKYQLQKLIVELINNFDNKLMQDVMGSIKLASGSHASSETEISIEQIEKAKKAIVKTYNKKVSVWSLLWKEVKDWWNDWMGTVFYGLIGVGATIGIGYSAYTSYWKNKRNFKLKDGENLKITLELYPENGVKSEDWYAYFYNDNSILDTDCSCQRKFKNKNSNNIFFVSYILRNGPTSPKLLLYKENKADNKKEELETDWFLIVDYYPGINKVPFYKYKSNKEKLGELVIKREIVLDTELCEICKKQENFVECECKSSKCTSINNTKKCYIAIEKKKCNICTNNEITQKKCKCISLYCTTNEKENTCCINIGSENCNISVDQQQCKCKTLCCAANEGG
ncbi:hypothetical protein [Mycoplasma phocimorsus]|uniref:hypothetical protein n=1 Tax=Mycoplasma phocimorsus TaxID=3045839 RepID=UPI0024BF9693|nr:hypothetical protein [Mycoplasma phocimorsus]MDJ1648931.1 hypothetical protein [Mycoplasma phocimorsus]